MTNTDFAETQARLCVLAADAIAIERLDAFVEQTTDPGARQLAVATADYQRAVSQIFFGRDDE